MEAVLTAFEEDGSQVAIAEDAEQIVTIVVNTRGTAKGISFFYDDRAHGVVWLRDQLMNFFISIYGRPMHL